MKKNKYTLVIAFSLVCAFAFAQEKKELKAIPEGWMPQQGDIALGISANPLLNYVGNLFNGTQNNSLNGFGGEPIRDWNLNFQPQYSIQGKYQLLDNVAIRANIGFSGYTDKYESYVQDDKAVALDPLSEDKVVDVEKYKRSSASFAIGAEYQKRYRKIQAYAGASLLYAFGKISAGYTYGNAITDINQIPSIASGYYPSVGYLPAARALEVYEDEHTNAFGIVGHIGVEWFFAPKISVGGELNVSFIHAWGAQRYTKYEGWNPATQKVEEYTNTTSPGSSYNSYGTDNLGGNIFVNFYF
ncbi:hypothetical protein FACS189434_04400 [Bacteroidia bacterium]|nr:hypothetical protein FACS189434_04400 [Bacteroidia bacterium]